MAERTGCKAALQAGTETEELEIVEVVKYKIVFSSRPEPVSGGDAE